MVDSTTQKVAKADAKKGEEMFSEVEDMATLLNKVYKLVEDYKATLQPGGQAKELVGGGIGQHGPLQQL